MNERTRQFHVRRGKFLNRILRIWRRVSKPGHTARQVAKFEALIGPERTKQLHKTARKVLDNIATDMKADLDRKVFGGEPWYAPYLSGEDT